MKKWANNYNKCKNCGTTRFRHKARGYCYRCYALTLKYEQVEKWQHGDMLKGYPPQWPTDADFIRRAKNMFIREIKKRLLYEKSKEDLIKGIIHIDGIDIEHLLQAIAIKVNYKNKNIYHGIANLIDHSFDLNQKRTIYRSLNKMLEKNPWRVDLTKIIEEK